ncbi:MAG TPA: YhjD/YihY/BrkB family envelope integrity protein [Frankiaceae bacterium]|nr:YhjD/YihY/BrkB family envelope integrity protein [Frankiaceae bacterium]
MQQQDPGSHAIGDQRTEVDEHDRTHSRLTGALRERASRLRVRLEPYEKVPVFNVALRTFDIDRESGGAVASSAIAFRMFLFFVPMLLLVVGIGGFLSSLVSPSSVEKATGVSGGLAQAFREALQQPGVTRTLAVVFGLFGTLSAGRSLGRVLFIASSLSWQEPIRRRAPLRTAGAIACLIVGMAFAAVIVNRLRQHFGFAVASLSFLPLVGLYAVAWLLVLQLLPRRTPDPGASLPGAALMGLTLAALQVFSELYLPDRFDRASQLYGAIGTTVVTLGWFFILGRAAVISIELNAAVYRVYGSISQFIFALPVLRILPRRSSRFRRFFDSDGERRQTSQATANAQSSDGTGTSADRD